MRRIRFGRWVFTAVLLAGSLVACSGGDDSGSGGAAGSSSEASSGSGGASGGSGGASSSSSGGGGAALTLGNLPESTTTATSASITYTYGGPGTVYCRRDQYTPIVCPNPFELGLMMPLALGSHTVDYYIDVGDGVPTAPSVSYTWTIIAPNVEPLPLAPMPAGLIASGVSASTWDGMSTVMDSGGNTIIAPLLDPSGSGQKVNLHRIYKNGSLIWGGIRAENAWSSYAVTKLNPGSDYWMAFAVMMKSDEPIVPNTSDDAMLVFQTHTPAQGNTQPDISLIVRGLNNQMFWSTAYNTYPSDTWSYVGGPNPDTEGSRDEQPAEPIPAAGTWKRYIVHYRPGFTTAHNPMFEVWRANPGGDYVKLFQDTGLNTYNSVVGPSYPRIGLYKWSSSAWNTNSLAFYLTPLHFGQGADLLEAAKASLAGL